MTTSVKSTQLTGEDRALLGEMTARLEAAWRVGPTTNLDAFLPLPGAPSRLPMLHALISRDMQIAWQQQQGRMLEQYLKRYPELGPKQDLPAALIFAEYHARSLAGEPAATEEYQRRFPEQFPALMQRIAVVADAETDDQAGTLHGSEAIPQLPATAGPKPIGTLPQINPNGSPGSTGAPAPAQTIPDAPPPTVPPTHPPSTFSQVLPVSEGFKLFRRIGRGQYGEVFLAEAPGGVNVAVKRIFRALDDESSQRELQSLQLIRELRHPFLLQTQAFWSLEDRLVIVMELADGSLAEWEREVRDGTGQGVPVEELLSYFQEAAEALDYLHSMNVIHRDVKPANLLRLKGHAKVADFGLARMMESQQLASATFCGTPRYMAPEVWKKKISPQSDQYSLAATYAEMRTGRPIYPGSDFVEICLQHTSATPDLTPLEDAEKTVLLRALAKDPDDRYPDCQTFAAALREAVTPPPPPTVVLAGRRQRGWIVAALGLGLLAILAVAAAVWAFTRPGATTEPEVLLPPDCQPDGTDKDGRYYKRILHPLPNASPILFLLIPSTKSGAPPFYIMRDKVSNGQFNAAAEAGMNNLLEEAAKAGAWAVHRQWNKDGRGDPEKATLPVVYVTMPEARCFAHFLGGELPTAVQWEKAAGMYDGAEGPFQPGAPPKGLAIALNRAQPPAPIPAGDPAGDESFFGCRDMADNGRELTATLSSGGDLVNLSGDLETSDSLVLRGGTFMGDEVFRFADIKKNKAGRLPVRNEGRHDIGFRVVIEAPHD